MQEELFETQSIAERVASETLIVDVDGLKGRWTCCLQCHALKKLTSVRFLF